MKEWKWTEFVDALLEMTKDDENRQIILNCYHDHKAEADRAWGKLFRAAFDFSQMQQKYDYARPLLSHSKVVFDIPVFGAKKRFKLIYTKD